MTRATDAWDGADNILDESACPVCRREICEGCTAVDEALDTSRERSPRPRLRAVRAKDLMYAPQPSEIVEGIATAGGLTVLVSESGAGKTFVLLDLAAHVSADIPWYGRQVEQGSVIYLVFEGAVGRRLRALSEVSGHPCAHVYVIAATDPLSPRVTRDGEEQSIGEIDTAAAIDALSGKLAASGEPEIRLVILDTVRASMTGSEDSSEHVAAYLRAVRRLMACVPNAAGILAHHAGWQDGDSPRKRERGSSSWRGNVDHTLYLERGEYDRERGQCELTLRTLKARDDEPAAPLHLIRRRVELPEIDRHGRPLTTCVIERDRRTRQDREAAEQQAADAETRTVDLRVLTVMRDQPEATSVRRIREYAALGEPKVRASIARILTAGWATPPTRQRLPYTVTEAGLTALEAQ